MMRYCRGGIGSLAPMTFDYGKRYTGGRTCIGDEAPEFARRSVVASEGGCAGEAQAGKSPSLCHTFGDDSVSPNRKNFGIPFGTALSFRIFVEAYVTTVRSDYTRSVFRRLLFGFN